MSIQDLGSIGEFISSIAVLVTLLYLAMQVRQTRAANVASTMLANRMQFQNIMLANRDSLIAPIIIKADKPSATKKNTESPITLVCSGTCYFQSTSNYRLAIQRIGLPVTSLR